MKVGLSDYARQMLSNENPYVLSDYEFYVTYTNLIQKIYEESENDQFQ